MTNLFILPTRLGDAILTTGAIDKYKDKPSTIVVTPLTAPLFADLPHLKRIIVMGKKPWRKHWFDIWKETRNESWDHIIDFRGSFLSYVLKSNKKYVWKQPRDPQHKVLQVSNCLKSNEPLSPTLWFSEERILRTKPTRPTLAVAPIAGWSGKQWPIASFITLLTKFCKKYPEAQVAILAAPNEKTLAEPLLKALPQDQCINTIGMDLLDLAAFLQSTRLFIGNDSGLMHISAAVKTPTLALFGPSNDQIYGPWSGLESSPHRVLRSMPLPRKKIEQTVKDTTCYMNNLPVSRVWETLDDMWGA